MKRIRWKNTLPVGVALASLALVGGCASSGSRMPDRASRAPLAGQFAWHDLVSTDVAASRVFYQQLLDWTFVGSGVDGYEWIEYQGQIIGGLVDATRLERTPRQSIWLNGVVVDDLEAAMGRVLEAGGQILKEAQRVPKRGGFAVVADREGALFQLVAENPLAASPSEPSTGQWLWTELLSAEAPVAANFYEAVLGVEPASVSDAYVLLMAGDSPQSGIVTSPFEETASVWVPFVRVADPAVTAARAVELGGRVVLAPAKDVRGGSLAIILDPGGAPLALQRWTAPSEMAEVSP